MKLVLAASTCWLFCSPVYSSLREAGFRCYAEKAKMQQLSRDAFTGHWHCIRPQGAKYWVLTFEYNDGSTNKPKFFKFK